VELLIVLEAMARLMCDVDMAEQAELWRLKGGGSKSDVVDFERLMFEFGSRGRPPSKERAAAAHESRIARPTGQACGPVVQARALRGAAAARCLARHEPRRTGHAPSWRTGHESRCCWHKSRHEPWRGRDRVARGTIETPRQQRRGRSAGDEQRTGGEEGGDAAASG
jgi:hypothetical protein